MLMFHSNNIHLITLETSDKNNFSIQSRHYVQNSIAFEDFQTSPVCPAGKSNT